MIDSDFEAANVSYERRFAGRRTDYDILTYKLGKY